MSLENPKVTVLMPVYNGEKYLIEAIDSVLNQNFTDFEFLIINDCSIDNSMKIINTYNDSRIHVIHNEKNLKLIATLNKGLDIARGEYVARMDCDDISMPERLVEQVAFMDNHPEVGICGTWAKTIGENEGLVLCCPTDSEIIKCRLFFESAFVHPTVILRRELLKKRGLYYDPSYIHAEDYEFWIRCSKYMSFANIGKVLLLYRLHPHRVEELHPDEQQASVRLIRLSQIEKLGIKPTEEEFNLHTAISTWKLQPIRIFVESAEAWLCKIKVANERTLNYPEPVFSNVIFERWSAVCSKAKSLGFWTLKTFLQSKLSKDGCLLWIETLRLSLKYVIRRCKDLYRQMQLK